MISTAATLRPAKLSGSLPGARQVEMKSLSGRARAAAVRSSRASLVTGSLLVLFLEGELLNEQRDGVLDPRVAHRIGIDVFDGALRDAAPDDLALIGRAG